MLGLGAKVLSLSNRLDNLNQEAEKAVQWDVSAASRNRRYFQTKRNLDELQRFRQILDSR
jgi:cell fate (sporulation/competence/biofilm development) regulator YlbF (YheA/YmcA/DUF963 family)